MTNTIVAPEATVKMVADFQKALLPAKLAPTQENGAALAIEMNRRGLPHTVENMLRAVNLILFDDKLTWLVEPAKLKARKANNAIQNQGEAKSGQDAFAAKVKAGEAADAQAKLDAETIKKIDLAINSYLPVDRRGHIAYGRQSEVQTTLRAHVKKELDRKVSPSAVFEKVAAYIAKLYREDELANERV